MRGRAACPFTKRQGWRFGDLGSRVGRQDPRTARKVLFSAEKKRGLVAPFHTGRGRVCKPGRETLKGGCDR